MNTISKFYLFLTVSMFFFLPGTYGQMKTVEGTTSVDKKPGQYQMAPKPFRENSVKQPSPAVSWKTLPLPGSNLLSGLKAGLLNEEGLPSYIEGKIPVDGKNISHEDMAAIYLQEARSLMKIHGEEISFSPVSVEKDDLGMIHVKFQQMYSNIPVYGAEIAVHGNEEGFDFLNGRYVATAHLENTQPLLKKEEAFDIIRSDFPEWREITAEISGFIPDKQEKTELVIVKNESGHFVLVYHATVYPNIGERWEYFVDATDGKIIDKYPSLCKFHGLGKKFSGTCNHNHTFAIAEEEIFDGKAQSVARDLLNVNRQINTYQVGNSYYLIDASRDMFSNQSVLPNDPDGVIWTIDAFNTSPAKSNFRYDHVISSNNTWVNSPAGVSSHYNGGKAFEYFQIVHNRNSIDGNKGNIISFINVADEDGSSLGNAFWNGAAMFYGNGDGAFLPLARGLDVAGHEMSHGVIQNTANLVYQDESGALNESFADIFGAMIDRDDWLIGEDVVKTSAFPSGALRSMSDPHNGAAFNDFGNGWQPKHYNERYTGSQDNGGVHINSGIPNHAFFLFASAVGKDKAERIFYRALAQYLTKSSKFADCRVAVVKAASDIHGANSPEVAAARKAFTDVGILGDEQGDYQNDAPTNPGQDFILFTNQNKNGLFITNAAGQPVSFGNPLTSRAILSKPSISDDGTEIVYVGADKKVYYININWATQQKTESLLGSDPVWRNAVISKDGFKIAAVTEELENYIYVFDFSGQNVVNNAFELYNPTFTNGVTTGDVLYADAMEFDLSGEYIMYDAENEILSNSSGTINYWDIGFIKVWNNESNTFALGSIEKLFSALPDDVSAGNPTFSKNSPYIVALDYIEDNVVYHLGANLETGDIGVIFENEVLGYPTYSPKDNQMMFDNRPASQYRIGRVNLQSNKIAPVANTAVVWLEGFRWATWFSNGDRVLSDSKDLLTEKQELYVFPNPTFNEINLQFENDGEKTVTLQVFNAMGQKALQQEFFLSEGNVSLRLPLTALAGGTYFVQLMSGNKILTTKLIQVSK